MSQNSIRNQNDKISLIIAGAQKAGTTSLKNYLGQHPDFQTHYQKEFAYFVDDKAYTEGYETALKKYFPERDSTSRLIAKSAGLYISEKAIIRLKEHNPDCKIVLILRNPVDRTYSSFLMEKNYGAISESFDCILDILEKKDPTDWRYEFFIGMSLYCRNLEMMLRHFSREQILLLKYEDLSANADHVCKTVFHWMNVDPEFKPDTSTRYNETRKTRSQTYGKFIQRVLSNSSRVKRVARTFLRGKMDYKVGEVMRNLNKTEKRHDPIPVGAKLRLIKFFEPYNNELSSLSGIDFSDWNQNSEKNGNGI